MKAMKIVTAAVLALGVSVGCGEPTAETPNGTDGGTSSGNDGGNNNNNGGSMSLNALDIHVTSLPATGEGSGVSGVIILKANSEDVTDATLTVNDVAVGYDSDENGYNLAKATFQNIGAGSTLNIKATRGSETASLTLDCPADVTLTPAAGTPVGSGETVTIGWTGNITYTNPVGKPYASIRPYDSSTKTYGVSPPTARNNALTGSSADLTVPPLPGGMDTYVAELGVAGAHKMDGDHSGYCRLVKRNVLAVK